MLNQFIVAGKVVEIQEPKYKDNGKPFQIMRLACQRDFKPYGKPLYDHILFVVYKENLIKQIATYVQVGQVITVTGRLQTVSIDYRDSKGEHQHRTHSAHMVDKIYFDKQREPLATEEEMAKYGTEVWEYIEEHDFIDGEEEDSELNNP